MDASELRQPLPWRAGGLDDDQTRCVTAEVGPIWVKARAGSGKTRVLTERIAYRALEGSLVPKKTVVVTFTRMAARELNVRLGRRGVDEVAAETFHSLGYSIIEDYRQDRSTARWHVTPRADKLMEEACSEVRGRPRAASMLSSYEMAVARGIDPSHLAEADELEPTERACFAAYEALKRRRRVLDMSDLLVRATAAIRDDANFAEAIRWRYRHLFVDEAQDMNRAQWNLLRAIHGDGEDIFVVGDPNQAIYGFGGADPTILTHDFPTVYAHVQHFELRTNYRSMRRPIHLADAVLVLDPPTRATTHAEEGFVGAVECYQDERAEARAIVWKIRQLHARGIGYSQLAVLARTKARLRHIEDELRRGGIACRTGRKLLDEPDVKEALRLLRHTGVDLPASSCVTELRSIVEELTEDRRSVDDTDRDVDDEPPPVSPAMEHRTRRLDQLLDLTIEWADRFPYSSLGSLTDWLQGAVWSRGGDVGEPHAGVELATFHRAKGLEWDHVLVVGLEDSLMPLEYSNDHAEEARLLYVALTRARTGLSMSWCRSTSTGERRTPSRYLPQLEAITGGAKPSEIEPTPDLGDRVRALRMTLSADAIEGCRRRPPVVDAPSSPPPS